MPGPWWRHARRRTTRSTCAPRGSTRQRARRRRPGSCTRRGRRAAAARPPPVAARPHRQRRERSTAGWARQGCVPRRHRSGVRMWASRARTERRRLRPVRGIERAPQSVPRRRPPRAARSARGRRHLLRRVGSSGSARGVAPHRRSSALRRRECRASARLRRDRGPRRTKSSIRGRPARRPPRTGANLLRRAPWPRLPARSAPARPRGRVRTSGGRAPRRGARVRPEPLTARRTGRARGGTRRLEHAFPGDPPPAS